MTNATMIDEEGSEQTVSNSTPEYAVQGAQLRAAREEAGLSREDVCRMTGIPVSGQSNYEQGNSRPGEQNWSKLYKAIGPEVPTFGIEGAAFLMELADDHLELASAKPSKDSVKLKAIRKFRGVNQTDAAEAIGSTASRIREIEESLTTPTEEEVVAFRELYGLKSVPTFGHKVGE